MTDSEVESYDMESNEDQQSGTGSDSESRTDESSGSELYNEPDAEDESEHEESNTLDEEGPEEKIIEKGKNLNLPFHTTNSGLKTRLEERKGKSLYIRFATKPPTDTAILEENMKNICKYIVNVRRPRQTSTRFCLVDFATEEDCDTAMKELKDVEIGGRKLIVQRPITEQENFEEKILEMRRQKQERILHWQNTKRSANSVPHKPNRAVSSLFVRNVPIGTSLEQLKEIFPKSIHMDLRTTKGDWLNAVVTMASPKDAYEEKQRSIKIGDSTLQIYFAREFKQPRMGFSDGRFPKGGHFINRGIPFKNKPDLKPIQSLDTKNSNKKLRKTSENGVENPVEKIVDAEASAKVTPTEKATTKDHGTLNIENPGKRVIQSKQSDEALKKPTNFVLKRKFLEGSESDKKNKMQKMSKKQGAVKNNAPNGKIKLNKQKVKLRSKI